MKYNIQNFTLFFVVITSLFFSSCKDEEAVHPEIYLPTQISDDITELVITKGDAGADTVWIFEQGGPAGKLDSLDLSDFPNYSNYLNVYVHQVLTYNNDLYDKELTVEEAEIETDVNSEILHKVIQYYKNQDKIVIVIGHSYGASVVTRYLSDKGSSLADKYVIMGGRLDAPEAFYEGLINKQFYTFPDFVTPVLHPTIQPTNNKQSAEIFLGGVMFRTRYTQKLGDVDFTKLIYAFANDDENIGRLSSDEQDFLVSKNVQIVQIESGGHSAMFDAPNNQIIYDLFIQ